MERAGSVAEGDLLWEPSEHRKARSNLAQYLGWLKANRGLDFSSYDQVWQWSVAELAGFWESVWQFFAIKAHAGYTQVLSARRMPGARWFLGAELNYAERALRRRDAHPAIIAGSEDGGLTTLTYAELHRQVAALAAGLRRLGVGRGDRVVAYAPNTPHSIAAFLAAASIGAIFSSVAPEFGVRSVVERFQQIEPRVLFAVDGYRYGGKAFDRLEAVAEIQRNLPTLTATVVIPYLKERPSSAGLRDVTLWDDLLSGPAELRLEPLPFDHPVFVLYSSGTTGLPKAIVHGHGGILLEHLKSLSLHMDLTQEDRFFWFTTTSWMMWNLLTSGLLLGATVLLYEGSPAYPDSQALWRFAERSGMTYFGTSAAYIQSCIKAGLEPGRDFDLRRIRGLGSTGSPLSVNGFKWVYEKVSPDLHLGSVSGGTDVCTAFVGPCPLLPVHAGEIQCRMLGAAIDAYDPEGRPVREEVGELVITQPLPSMPLFFWNDPDGRKYRASYFETFPGVWRHGDWIKITSRGSAVIYGRSDSTLNRAGVRMGTADFYRVVEELPEVLDSLVVDTGQLGREGRLLLFVVLRDGVALDDPLKARIHDKLRREVSPRHVPDAVYAIAEVPRTLTGKKLEVPAKRILTGTPPERAVSRDAMSNPESIQFFVELAQALTGTGKEPQS